MRDNFLRFLFRNFSAQSVNQFVSIVVPLVSIPVLLKVWGVDRYGVWAYISAIPVYLSFSDFGFTFVAKNLMAIKVFSGDRSGALRVYQSVFVLLCVVSVVVVLMGGLVLLSGGLDKYIVFESEAGEVVKFSLFFLLVSAVAYQFLLLMFSGVRSEGRSDVETYFSATSRLFDFSCVVAVALCGGGILGASVSFLVSRLISISCVGLWLRAKIPWVRLGFEQASVELVKELFVPSVRYMLIPLANAGLVQGPLLVLGVCQSPVAVSVFTVMRTIARTGASFGNVINYVFTPAYSYSYGQGDVRGFLNRVKLHSCLVVFFVLSYVSVFYFFGKNFFDFLSHGKLPFDSSVFVVLLMGVVVEMCWTFLLSPGSAINEIGKVSYVLLAGSLTFFLISSLACLGSYGISVGILLVGCSCLVFSSIQFYRVWGMVSSLGKEGV